MTEDHKVAVTFKYDTLCTAYIRINMCVTEKKNPNNAPEMFYTPNRENYIANLQVPSGLDQEVAEGAIEFDINYLAAFELAKAIKDYYPMIISVNYSDDGAQYAMMTYCTFTKDGEQNINGVHVVKQVALVSLPLPLAPALTALSILIALSCADQRPALRTEIHLRHDERGRRRGRPAGDRRQPRGRVPHLPERPEGHPDNAVLPLLRLRELRQGTGQGQADVPNLSRKYHFAHSYEEALIQSLNRPAGPISSFMSSKKPKKLQAILIFKIQDFRNLF